jgi:cell fate regulator YaaT (PSP1 superfamily)
MAERQRVPVGVRFKEAGKVYYFDAGDLDLAVGEYVVVETSHGQEVGRVVISPDQVIASEIKESLKPVLRQATPEDLERSAALKKEAKGRVAEARKRALQRDLPIYVVAGDYSLDGTQLTLYFTAEDQVEVRSFARELSEAFDTKVQLLQVGERDRAKLTDGIGWCGERLCCSSWLTTFPTVSIRMAKEQDLPINPSKLSGQCGRLLCCLTYEYDQYREIKGGLPKVGATVSTPTGEAKVLRINVPRETITLLIKETAQTVDMPLDQFRLMYGTAVRPKELVETFEKELMAAGESQAPAQDLPPPPAPVATAPLPPAEPTVEEQPAAESTQPKAGEGRRQRRRRRGRRSRGRKRR